MSLRGVLVPDSGGENWPCPCSFNAALSEWSSGWPTTGSLAVSDDDTESTGEFIVK